MSRRRWLRWLPAIVAPVVIAGGAFVSPFAASAAVDLPAKTPEQLLTMVGESHVTAFSGMVEQESQLGLPQLPKGTVPTDSAVASIIDLLTGTHTARVFVDGPTKLRVQVLDQLAERDVIRSGNDVWLYSSEGNTATHIALPAGTTDTPKVPQSMLTPAELAHRLLSAVQPSTDVTVGQNTTVAGRTAYNLVLDPRSLVTLVDSVSIAIDSETGLPLGVTVQARGQQDPAFRLAFSALSLETPPADTFEFSPPPGATVKQQALPQHPSTHEPDEAMPAPGAKPTVTGTGWDTVISLPAAALPADLLNSPVITGLTKTVPGGRLLSCALMNVLITNTGQVFAGAVTPDRLQSVASGQ